MHLDSQKLYAIRVQDRAFAEAIERAKQSWAFHKDYDRFILEVDTLLEQAFEALGLEYLHKEYKSIVKLRR